MNKQQWLELAEILDALRVFPRLFFFCYIVIFALASIWVMFFVPVLTTMHTILLSTIFGVGAAWFGLYVKTGKMWKDKEES